MSNSRALNLGRVCAVLGILTALTAIALTFLLAAPQRGALAAVLACALLWGLGGSFAVALTPGGSVQQVASVRDDRPDSEPSDRGQSDWGQSDVGPTGEGIRVGTLMNLGRVPDQVARMTSAIAAASGPVLLVVPPDRDVPVGIDPAVVVVQSQRPMVSAAMIEFTAQCDAALVTSARAMPSNGCREAARLIAEGASWVQGRAEPLNHDRFGPTGREVLDAKLRLQATTARLWCWEPDATLISTALLREHPMPTGRPLGSWLRTRDSEGASGAVVDAVLTRRAAPVAAEGYWPDTTARQCAAAADLSDAARSGFTSLRARAIAAGLLVRALSGWSVVLWLAALVLLTDGSPVRHSSGLLAALVGASVVMRWLAPRFATGTRPSPVADLIAGLYALPGSLSATFSAATRRVRPPRRAVSTRPLVWLGLLATAAAANVVLTARPGVPSARLAAGAAAGLLVLTWVFTVRSIVERSWRRVGFRIPLDLPAIVGEDDMRDVSQEQGAKWRLVDGGPGGCALAGPATGHARGDEVTVRVPTPDGAQITLNGTVAGVRQDDLGDELLGIEIITVEQGSAAWARQLTEAAARNSEVKQESATPSATTTPPVSELVEHNSWGRRIDRLAVGLVIVVSVAVVLTLGLVLVGLRPLVIRSGSMVPTYGVGDVVLVSSQQADSIQVGQVVTRFDAPEAADSLTHRVQRVRSAEGEVQVMTRGDANNTSEEWSVSAQQHVGVVVASVPAIGLPLTMLRSSTGWALVVAASVLVVIGMLFRPRHLSKKRGQLSEECLKPGGEPPTTSPMSTTGEAK